MSKHDNLGNITYVGHMLVTDLVAVISCRKALPLCLQRTISTPAGALKQLLPIGRPMTSHIPLRFDTQRSSTHEAPFQTSAKPAQVPLDAPRSKPRAWEHAAEATFWADLAILQALAPCIFQAQPSPQATSLPSYPAPSSLTPRNPTPSCPTPTPSYLIPSKNLCPTF